MTYWPQSHVYGVLMNQRSEWAMLARQMNQPPHNSPPVAPVLYTKTANTSIHTPAFSTGKASRHHHANSNMMNATTGGGIFNSKAFIFHL